MAASHEIILIHKNQNDFAKIVICAVCRHIKSVLGESTTVIFKDKISDASPSNHATVIYLGSVAGHDDKKVRQALRDAMDSQFSILPIVRKSDPGAISKKLPKEIALVNAADWENENERNLALASLLRMLGLVEDDRKVFLSYRRDESASIAIQLHTKLVQAQFDVFLDRFAIPPGDKFQERLDEYLGDMAFVVLLESPGLRDSKWVQHEIAYAHSHRIKVLALTLPDVDDSKLTPSIDDAFRTRLTKNDLSNGELTTRCVQKILEEIELAHARAIRRRREQTLGSLKDLLRRDNCSYDLIDDWTIFASGNGRKSSFFLVTPRRPRPGDLYDLDKHRGKSHHNTAAAIVHEVEHMADRHRSILRWIGKPRNLGIKMLHNCVLER